MEKKRLEIIVTSALIAVCILFWIKTLKGLRKESPLKKALPLAVPSEVGAGRKDFALPLKQIPVAEEADLNWGRDPFSGYEYSVGPREVNLKLSGILWDDQKPACIINDNIVGKGERVAGQTVVDIRKDKVILNDGNRDFELKLPD